MKICLPEKKKIINLKNLSKNGIIKKVNNIKSSKVQHNKIILRKRNNEGINLFSPKNAFTYYNLYNFKKSLKNRTKKLKNDLLIESDYSSFIGKNSKYFSSEFPLTGLLTPNIFHTELEYRKLFRAKSNLSEDRTKYSTSKVTKSNNIKNEFRLLSAQLSKSNIHYSKNLHNSLLKSSFSKYNRERVSDFMEKSRIIRRNKIIKIDIENKILSEEEGKNERINLFDNIEKDYSNKSLLLKKFMDSYDDYIKNIEIEKSKENQICDELNKKILILNMNNENLQKKIDKLKIIKSKCNNIKNFFLKVKYGTEALENKDNLLTYFQNIENQKNIKNKILSKSSNPIVSNKESIKKKKIERYYSINKFKRNSKIMNEKSINRKEKRRNKTVKKTKNTTNDQTNNNESNLEDEDEYQFVHTFTNLENILLNDLNYLNTQKRNKYELRKIIKEAEKKKENKNNNSIESKIKMLDFLKKENTKLKNKIKILIKVSPNKENFKTKLEKKLFVILKNINEQLNIQEIFGMKDLFYMLKMEPNEFVNKMHISKILYTIKIIEKILLLLFDLKNRYLNDKKTEVIFKIISDKVEKEKNKLMHKLNKEQIKQNLEDKKIDILNKHTKIRFHSSKKFYYQLKNKRNSYSKKKKILKKNNSNNIYEQWLTFN